jgi:hypothetical protein
VLLLAAKDDAPSVEERAMKAAAALNAVADAASQGGRARSRRAIPPRWPWRGQRGRPRHRRGRGGVLEHAGGVAAHWAALVGDYLAMFARGERPTRLFAVSGRARTLLDLQTETGFRPGAGVAALRMTQLSVETSRSCATWPSLLAAPAQGQAGVAVEGSGRASCRTATGC